MTAPSAYVFDNDKATANPMHDHLSAILDDFTQRRLLRAGITDDLVCWEIGAGNGSVAVWLGDQLDHRGQVFATDIKPQHIQAHPKVLPLTHDVAAVFVGVTFPVMLGAAFVAFLGGQALVDAGTGASLGDDGALGAIVGSAGYVTAVGVLGIAVGFLIRKVGAAIALLFGAVFVLPLLANLIPASWSAVVAYLPSTVGSAIYSVSGNPDLLSSGTAVMVLLGYVVAMVGAAAITLKRRDA